MKNHIHTIPVISAFKDPGYCPFCKMQQSLDADAVHFIMGPAYMDEEVRDKTNEAGFCEEHLKKIYEVQNRLGFALLIHTHLKHLQKTINKPDFDKPRATSGLFKKPESQLSIKASQLNQQQKRCYLCEKVQDTFDKYVDTFFYMWSREPEILELINNLPAGFCITHYGMLLEKSEIKLGKKHIDDFLNQITTVQQKAIAKLEADMDWFVQKFDYRNADAPWKDSKDALTRAMAMLKGIDYNA